MIMLLSILILVAGVLSVFTLVDLVLSPSCDNAISFIISILVCGLSYAVKLWGASAGVF